MSKDTPSDLRDKATENQQELLQKYAELIASNTKDATIQAIDDQITHYELQGIQQGYKAAKQQVVGMMQKKLDSLNKQNSEKIIKMRAELPELQNFDEELGLNSPSLQEGIDNAHKTYNVLAETKKNNDLPDDLSDALNA